MTEETQQQETSAIEVIQVFDGFPTESEMKSIALGKVLSVTLLPFDGVEPNPVVSECNPRLFEITEAGVELYVGQRYMVATAKEYEHIRHTLVFDQLPLMDLDLLMNYVFQDMNPDEVKVVLNGLLLAPEDVVSSYTKSRMLSMILNFEALLADFIRDEDDEEAGIYRIQFTNGQLSETIYVTEAFLTEADAQIASVKEEGIDPIEETEA